MDTIHIQGGVALEGKVRIQGSKNASLPILAATLLTEETTLLSNCPKIADVHGMVSLLRSLGCNVSWEEKGIRISPNGFNCGNMPRDAITSMRSSLCLLGALIGKCGEVLMEYPGGCVIGKRPIDIHLWALEKMGVEFTEEEGKLHALTRDLHGANITLPLPSVGATENIILAAVMAEGETIINGAAEEPEVAALCEYLELCGAQIEGAGTSILRIHGGRRLLGAEYVVPADRIVAGTYMLACIGAGGCVFLENAPVQQLQAMIELARKLGATCETNQHGIVVQASGRPCAVPYIQTKGYPGFPTDLQSQVLAVMSTAEGQCVVEESIFENRFRVVKELRRMGANIEFMDDRRVRVTGVERLHGANVEAQELRGGAALVIAGLIADKETKIVGGKYIYRGYENICRDFRELGARIVGV